MSAALCLAALAAVLPPDPDPPKARIDFPLPSALTDAATIRMRGAAHDPDGVAAVRVNGVPASTVDGFATWWAVVRLELGENELVVETVDALGNLDRAATSTMVRRDGAIVTSPYAVAHDVTGRRTWIADIEAIPGTTKQGFRVMEVDTATRQVTVVSSRWVGSGPLPDWPDKLRFDPHSGGLLLVDFSMDALLRIDVDSGDRTVISGAGVGTGTPFVDPVDLAVDPLSPRAWVVQTGSFGGNGAVLEVNLINGHRKVVSTHNVGSGPWPTAPYLIAVAPGNLRAVVQFTEDFFSPGTMPLIAVDLVKGHRSWITDGPVPPQRPWINPKSLVVPAGDQAFVGDNWYLLGGVFAVQLATGEVWKVSDEEHPAGPLTEVVDLAWNASTQRVTTIDAYRDALLAMHPTSGSFDLVFRSELGSGPKLSKNNLRGIATDGRRAILLDSELDHVLEVDLRDGRRSVVSGASKGEGPLWTQPVWMAVDSATDPRTAFVIEWPSPRIYSVDLDTGDRELVASPDLGSGPWFESPGSLAFDPVAGSLLVLDELWSIPFLPRNRIFAVDVRTGDREVLSDADHGNGPPLLWARDLVLDARARRLWVDSLGALLEIDLRSGDRRLFSGHGVGAGPAMPIGGPMVFDSHRQGILIQAGGAAAGHIFAVDAVLGDRSPLVNFADGVGPGSSYLSDFALLPDAGGGDARILISDMFLSAVVAVDLFHDASSSRERGWRCIVSR